MPLTEEKPLFHSSEASYNDYSLYLDFSKKEVLQGLYFTCDGENNWKESFQELVVAIEGKTYHEIIHMNFRSRKAESFFDLPLFLLKEALDNYRGKAPEHCLLKNQKSEELICRCFGVYREEILEFLDSEPEANASQISNATKAGAGCSTCLEDFSELMAEAKSRQAQKLLTT